jgi:hypothetical protein
MWGAGRRPNNKKSKNRTISYVLSDSVAEVLLGEHGVNSVKEMCCANC